MNTPEENASPSREELLALVAELQRQVTALQEQVAQLAADNQELRAEVDRLTRQSKRQAAPFSRGTRTQQPKRPSRQPGEGTFSFRQAPRPEEITGPALNVPVTWESCPGCGGKLTEQRVDFAYVTDLPPLPQPRVTQYWVWVCRCTNCGRRVRGEPPDLAPDQYGATAHRLGARAKAVAHILHYSDGYSRKEGSGSTGDPGWPGRDPGSDDSRCPAPGQGQGWPGVPGTALEHP